MSDKQTVQDNVNVYALNEKHHHQGIVTAQHSLFLWGQTGCDVYVTCTASWPGHAPEPHAIHDLKKIYIAIYMHFYNLCYLCVIYNM